MRAPTPAERDALLVGLATAATYGLTTVLPALQSNVAAVLAVQGVCLVVLAMVTTLRPYGPVKPAPEPAPEVPVVPAPEVPTE